MRHLVVLLIHLVVTIARLLGPGGVRSIVAESLLVNHQLLILNRSRRRAPDLRPLDRIIAGLFAGFLQPARLIRSAIVLKPATILSFHRALVERKYGRLFSPKRRGKPGPKGPSSELITAIVEMKRRNPTFGYQRIADQFNLAFGLRIEKDVVRRLLAAHYKPGPGSGGSSWLTFLGHSKDSLWSVDFFRCQSLALRTHRVMVVIDQCTRRIIGFAVHSDTLDGPAVCRLFGRIISGSPTPTYLSSDNDPLFEFHRWKANLRILDIAEIKTVPYAPISHPFVERLIGTVRREYLDHVPSWGKTDLERKLSSFKNYYNEYRAHQGIKGKTPDGQPSGPNAGFADLHNYRWKSFCRGLYQLPMAA
jgi:transposase InsO family protein